jgi:hypothetical protein
MFHSAEQLSLVCGSNERLDTDVLGDVEIGSVHPDRPAESEWRAVEALAKPGHQVEVSLDSLSYDVDSGGAVVGDQLAAVQNGERPDVHRPANLVRAQHYEVRCGQAFHAHRRGFPLRR